MADAFRERGVSVQVLEKDGVPGPVFLRRVRAALRDANPDIVQTHGFSAGVWGRLGSVGLCTRRLVTVHEEAGWMRPRRRKLVNRLLLPLTEKMIAVSTCVRDSLVLREGIPAERIVTIANGIDPSRYRRTLTAPEARRILGIDPGGVWIGMIGRCRREKGGDVFIHALAELCRRRADVRGVLIGDGPDCTQWRGLAAELGLGERLRFTGFLPDVRPWMQALDVLAVPSRQESSGLVVLEAFAAGCPVVASRVGGIPDWLTDGEEGLLVPPEDPAALAAVLGTTLSDPEAARSRALRAREAFQCRGSVDRTVRDYVRLYAELSGGNSDV
jgi:glycosyltransferase involved in cell wall biosynthesis